MAKSRTTLPPVHALVAEAIRRGMPEDRATSFQLAVERWLGETAGDKSARKPLKSKKIAWKERGPMRSGGCGQCGDIPTRRQNCGPHDALCERCFAVLENSRKWWKPNDEFPSAG